MRNRHRWMFYMTGLPGWMRFGFSPGWIGRSPMGLGPAAQYLLHGTWPTPQMDYAWQQGQIPFSPRPGFPQPNFLTPYDPWGIAEKKGLKNLKEKSNEDCSFSFKPRSFQSS